MNIYLREKSGNKVRFAFPVLPEEVKVKCTANYQTYNIIGQGSVKIPKGMDPDSISWNGFFVGESRKKAPFIVNWTSPYDCVRILKDWQDSGTILNLILTETPVNIDVTIQSFTYTPTGAFGDYEYSITLAKYKEIKVYTTEELEITEFVKKIVSRPTEQTGKTYTVVDGDTLWGIAQNMYGDGTKWQTLYDANKDVIENTAIGRGLSGSDYGHWIFTGTVLTVP